MLTTLSVQKLSLSFLVSTAVFLFSVSIFSPNVYAVQRTCCKANPDGSASGDCDGCRPEGKETKNYGDSCGGASSSVCEVCPATHPKSNVCGGGSSGSTYSCTVGRIVVRDASGATNYGPYGYGSTLSACAAANSATGLITKIRATSKNASILSYAGQRLPASGTYLAKDTLYCMGPAGTIVGAGSANIGITVYGKRCPACAEEVMCQGTTSAVTGSAPLACIPGATCKPASGTTPVYGGNMACSMPTITKPSQYANHTLKYYVKCDVYSGTTLVKAGAVNLSSTTPTFAQFKLNYRGSYKCSFRHCFENAAGKSCSAWGKAV